MRRTSMVDARQVLEAATRQRRALRAGLVFATLLAACTVQVQNLQPARELARLGEPPPTSVYTGWRVFQDKCAGCHGPAATGTAAGPDLLPRLREMGPRQFVGLVLRRYDSRLALTPAGTDSAAREALIDRVVRREAGALEMPAWQGEPRVNAHVADLFSYLAARAEGTQGPARPLR